jgi:hypothetical protein
MSVRRLLGKASLSALESGRAARENGRAALGLVFRGREIKERE